MDFYVNKMITKSNITANKIYNEFLKKEISKVAAIEILISLIEGANNDKTRINSIEILGKISHKNKKIFKILENILISDENSSIRAKAASIIIDNYLDEGYSSLNWSIKHDTSKIVLKTYIDKFKVSNNIKLKTYNLILKNRLKSIYGVVPEEAIFLLDLELEVDFFNVDYLKIYSTNTENGVTNGNYMMCAIKNEHIKAINLSNWGIHKIPESIAALTKLKHLILKNNPIRTLPKSIGTLSRLKSLDLSSCKIISLPNSMIKLKKLRYLSLEQNPTLKKVPEIIIEIAKRYLKKKYLWEGVESSEAFVLAILEIFSGSRLKRMNFKDIIIDRDDVSTYKMNENGNIVGIYIFNNYSSKLAIFPKQICSLKYLEEIEFPNNDIQKIPKSIKKLSNLQHLNLRNNLIHIVPESLSNLKNLKMLKLSGNNIGKKLISQINLVEALNKLDGLNTIRLKKHIFSSLNKEMIREI